MLTPVRESSIKRGRQGIFRPSTLPAATSQAWSQEPFELGLLTPATTTSAGIAALRTRRAAASTPTSARSCPGAAPEPSHMTLYLHVFNPSHYPRCGFVTTAWQPIYERTRIPPGRVAVFDAAGRQLDTQVHKVDPGDPSSDVLVFWLDDALAPGHENVSAPPAVVRVGVREREMSSPELKCEPEGPEGEEYRVMLSNGRLSLSFELTPAPWGDGLDWYAGSATTV